MATTYVLTAQDVERMGAAGERMELIDGVLQGKPGVSQRHSEIEMMIASPLHVFVLANALGRVYTPDAQFVIQREPDRILIPDIAFVRTDRLPPEEERWRIAWHTPDLAVEVMSPNDSYPSAVEKVGLSQRAGVPLVWLVRARRRQIEVFPLGRPSRLLSEGDTLDGGDVIPGFTLPVADIFR